MNVLIFIYLAVSMGQPLSAGTIENVQYAVFDSESSCREHTASMSASYKHMLLTQYQAVPLFMAVCKPAVVFNTDINKTTHFSVTNKKVDDHDLE